jgi:hypothetical protein
MNTAANPIPSPDSGGAAAAPVELPDPVSLQILVKALAASAAAVATSRFGAQLAAVSSRRDARRRRGQGRREAAALGTKAPRCTDRSPVALQLGRQGVRPGCPSARLPGPEAIRLPVAACPGHECCRGRHRRRGADAARGGARALARDGQPDLHVLPARCSALAGQADKRQAADDLGRADRGENAARRPGSVERQARATAERAMAPVRRRRRGVRADFRCGPDAPTRGSARRRDDPRARPRDERRRWRGHAVASGRAGPPDAASVGSSVAASRATCAPCASWATCSGATLLVATASRTSGSRVASGATARASGASGHDSGHTGRPARAAVLSASCGADQHGFADDRRRRQSGRDAHRLDGALGR